MKSDHWIVTLGNPDFKLSVMVDANRPRSQGEMDELIEDYHYKYANGWVYKKGKNPNQLDLFSGFSCGQESGFMTDKSSFYTAYTYNGLFGVRVRIMRPHWKLTNDTKQPKLEFDEIAKWTEAFLRRSHTNFFKKADWPKTQPNYVSLKQSGSVYPWKYGALATLDGKNGKTNMATMSNEIRRDGKVIPLKHFVVAIDGTWYAHKEDIAKF